MMTPQEVASSTFPKSTIGGYNMAAVDVFLDKLTEDYSALHKENAALKAKIKVLVDKMEEYHAMEDTMRSTLLTAQKMATNMVSDAEQKANSVLAAVENTARERTRELQAAIADEEQRLVRTREEVDAKIEQEHSRLVVAQRELTAFINASRKLCSRQLDLRFPKFSRALGRHEIFDRCAFSPSLYPPPAAVGLKAANSTTSAYNHIINYNTYGLFVNTKKSDSFNLPSDLTSIFYLPKRSFILTGTPPLYTKPRTIAIINDVPT